jgi:hypothetical protein
MHHETGPCSAPGSIFAPRKFRGRSEFLIHRSEVVSSDRQTSIRWRERFGLLESGHSVDFRPRRFSMPAKLIATLHQLFPGTDARRRRYRGRPVDTIARGDEFSS